MSSSLFRTKKIDAILKTAADEGHGNSLRRVLTARDLTFFGIAAIIGALVGYLIGKSMEQEANKK
jgi:hypothetical protein